MSVIFYRNRRKFSFGKKLRTVGKHFLSWYVIQNTTCIPVVLWARAAHALRSDQNDIRSVIDYANNLKQPEIAKLEHLQYRAATLAAGDLHFSNKDKLNSELGWETISTRIKFLGLSLFHKIYLRLTRPLVTNCLSQLDWKGNNRKRSKGGYKPYPNYSNHLSFHIPKSCYIFVWNASYNTFVELRKAVHVCKCFCPFLDSGPKIMILIQNIFFRTA